MSRLGADGIGQVQASVAGAELENPIGIGKWKRPEEDRVGQREHGGYRADTKPQGENHRNRESWIPPDLPECRPQIVAHGDILNLDARRRSTARPSWRYQPRITRITRINNK